MFESTFVAAVTNKGGAAADLVVAAQEPHAVDGELLHHENPLTNRSMRADTACTHRQDGLS